MTLEEIFSVVYVSTNANNIRRTAGQQTALNVSGAETQDFIAEKYRQAGLSVTVTSSTVTARLAGTSDRCFFITAGYASAAVPNRWCLSRKMKLFRKRRQTFIWSTLLPLQVR